MSEDRILDKIQKLIDKAYGNTTDAEQKLLLEKADELMLKYSIDQMQLQDPNRPSTAPRIKGTEPILRDIPMSFEGADYYVQHAMQSMFRAVAKHLFVRVGSTVGNTAKCVGYPADLDFLEMFYLRIKLHMVSNLNPKVEPEEDWVANVTKLKNAGYKWERIHRMMDFHPTYPYAGRPWDRKFPLARKMKEYCEKYGIERNTASNLDNWRWDFISGYVYRLNERFRETREATMRTNDLLPALLNDKRSDVEEAFFNFFPDLRPHADDCQCPSCKVVTGNSSGNRRAVRRAASTRVFNADAYGRGAKVANTADLSAGGSLK